MKIESEKLLEQKLKTGVESLGGIYLKLLPDFMTGLPDRLCLIPQGKVIFVELKTTKKKPRKIQLVMIGKIRKLGFRVEIIDTSEQIKKLISEYE